MTLRFSSMFLALLFLQGCASKWKNLTEAPLLNDKAKLQKNVEIAQAFPPPPTLSTPPKRIALVSFYIAPWGGDGGGRFVKYGTTAADHMLKESLSSIKDTFKQNGMEILEPSEFLTDDNKKTAFNNFRINTKGKWQNLFNNNNKRYKNSKKPGIGVATGHIDPEHDVRWFTYGPVFAEQLGNTLAKTLEVDAVLLVGIQLSDRDDIVDLQNASMYVFGPNPAEATASNNQTGNLYGHVKYKDGFFEYIGVVPKDASTVDAETYRGFAKVIEPLSATLAKHIKEKTTTK